MNLKRKIWTINDGIDFNKYLYSLRRKDKMEWTKNILNTNMITLAVLSPKLKEIAKEISKGNYISFLDLNLNNYYENTYINAYLIVKIKNFDKMKQYLDRYSLLVDNWSSCDTLKFNIKDNEEKYFNLSLEYIKSELPFRRRIGILILFKFINNEDYLDKVYNIIDMFYNEDSYYVNMIISWLLCELMIKQQEKTLLYLKRNKLNDFTINKFISKCRDSYRIDIYLKEYLLNYKRW